VRRVFLIFEKGITMREFLKIFLTSLGIVTMTVNLLAMEETHLNLLPVPSKIQITGDRYRLDADFKIAIEGKASDRLYQAATRTLRRLSGRTGLFFPQDFITANTPIEGVNLLVRVKRIGALKIYEDESYRLTITRDNLLLEAETDLGALHGFETLLQLLSADESGYYFPTVVIEDTPRFTWRGLLIDVSRHFMPVEVIKRNLDGMAAVKMNVLHWHLVDDQGFRVECRTFPKLHEQASDGFYYTQTQVREIIKYAAERGIRVIPEFDVPAHATAWCVAYPELASAPGPYKLERRWGVFDPTLNPIKGTTYEFLDKFFQEMATLFDDDYIHIGGDENNGKQWDANAEIQTFMKKNNIKDNHELQRYFNQRVLKILTKHGKKMIGWDEIFQPGLPTDIVVHCWRDRKYLENAASQGYMGILSNGYYIDLIQPAEFHYLNDPLPPESQLSPEAQQRIVGGEATSWGELVTYETIDSRIWPRTAAIAERLWSPATVRDVDDLYRRLDIISRQLEELDLTHRKNYEMMLRRLANSEDILALKNFVDIVEPVKIYQRHFQGVTYTSYSPYTRVVDAARPESMTARQLQRLVNDYLERRDSGSSRALRAALRKIASNHQELMPVIKSAPILWEIEDLSANSAALAQISLIALDYLDAKQEPPATFQPYAETLLKTAQKPAGQVELAIVKPLQKLISAATE